MRPREPALLLLLLVSAAIAPAPAATAEAAGAGPPHTREAARVTPRQARADVGAASWRRGSWVVKVLVRTAVRSRPGRASGRRLWTAPVQTEHAGHATELLVEASRVLADGSEWFRVQLPRRPNGSAGWVSAAAVRLRRTPWFVRVSLTRRELVVGRLGRVVRRVPVVIGAGETPTPRGLFAVYELAPQLDPNGFLGPWALHLTGFSDVLTNYGGGPGRLALHGRGGASLRDPLGSAGSHRCIRMPNADVRWLASRLRPGTPVRIAT